MRSQTVTASILFNDIMEYIELSTCIESPAIDQMEKGYSWSLCQFFLSTRMNKRNRAQIRLLKDYEELQNDPPYVGISDHLHWLGNQCIAVKDGRSFSMGCYDFGSRWFSLGGLLSIVGVMSRRNVCFTATVSRWLSLKSTSCSICHTHFSSEWYSFLCIMKCSFCRWDDLFGYYQGEVVSNQHC